MNTLLVTGVAGYIGFHTIRLLADKNYKIVVIDNMIYGYEKEIVNKEVIPERYIPH